VVGQSAEGGSGHSLLVIALQPAWILAAKSHPGQNGRFAASGDPWDLAQPAQLRGLRWSTWRRFDPSSSPSASKSIDIAERIVMSSICATFPTVSVSIRPNSKLRARITPYSSD
jgi:hypothetical protein